MLPIGPLMIEHRLIERMVDVLKAELDKIKKTGEVDPFFIDLSVDFFRTYADETHHGKEEDILFRELKKKSLNPEHEKM
ncbi:MAG: cation-binding protein, partial [Candidatus Lokiarchaeota archaeon]|nr:cation-binding protein [Candidatus Lokiarchaeota archaeon]MBD3340583.1 cation-binding protein [Candidatus Lokiarchaeota archaeon]